VVVLDGKTVCGSHDRANGKAAIHMVSAWATQRRVVLAHHNVDHSNEITAIPEVLRLLDLDGCTVAVDAVGCQTAIAKQIVEQGANYVLAVKENHEQLYHDIVDTFRYVEADGWTDVAYEQHRTVNGGHGRVEQRDFWLIREADYLRYLNPKQQRKKLCAIGMVEAERRVGEEISREWRFYLLYCWG
jgi:predicted transposase YbfD/YdcC